MGKRSDKVTAYVECRIVARNNAPVGTFFGGDGQARWMTAYSGAARQIRELEISSDGSVKNGVYIKKRDKWSHIAKGSYADGTKTEDNLTVTISDNGNTHIWTGSTTAGGKKVDELHDVWRRVSK